MRSQNYFRALRERFVTVLVSVVVAVLAAGATWYFRPPEYTAVLQMYVSAQSTDTAQAAFQGAQLSQQRVASYVELVSSPRVRDGVIGQLNLATTPDDLGKHISATTKPDSVIISVAVRGESPQGVAAIANAVGTIFPRLIDELERPSSPTGTPPVVVRVIQPAAVPDRPSSAGLVVSLLVGTLAGIAIGIGGALTRNAMDTSIKSPDQLREIAHAPNLGSIAFDPAVPKHPLTLHEDPQSPRSEAFRALRTNLQFLDVDTPHKVLVVTSSLPGEGKTTSLANLATAIASSGQRVLVIEADLRRPKLADVLGLDRSVGLTSVLAGRVRAERAVQHWSGGVFDVLASGPLPPNPSELLGSQHMGMMLAEMRPFYDVILLDTPPLLPVTDAAALAPATDGAILICRFKQTRRDQVLTAAKALSAVSAPLLGTVLTMVPAKGSRAYAQYHSYYASSRPVVDKPVASSTRPPRTPPGSAQHPYPQLPPSPPRGTPAHAARAVPRERP